MLSIRDLDDLIYKAVSREVLERSRSAIDAALDILPVFVPTVPYYEAWKTLNKYYFVVLEGPPEMGKTAIAWMVGINLLTNGWQVLVCDTPHDFFTLYESRANQVFIADDAFGRTEYDPSRGKEWERQLVRILKRIDQKHWLIWTTRKHILERALNSIDLQLKVEKFPKQNEVLVETSRLSAEEKALILYRHARAAKLESFAKGIIKANAKVIVNNTSFTPERIRRFVIEVLPGLDEKGLELENQFIVREIQKAIQSPTERMRKSFRALKSHHKLFLTTLLEANYRTSIEELERMYKNRSMSLNTNYPLSDIIDELSESFIKLT